jgi:diguanylate cyclase (GGDEF)-like protein
MSGILIVLAGAGGLCALLTVPAWHRERRARLAAKTAASRRRELLEALQAARSEAEVHDLVRRQVERDLPDAAVTFVGDSESCAAVRLGREYGRRDDRERLLACPVCGPGALPSSCFPAVAGGAAFGSFLVERPGGVDRTHVESLRELIALAGPALANLRTIAAAETRAGTDALTGLPNSRALQEVLSRMVAQAGRTASPLSAILFDLDNFRRLNEMFGHDRGDDVLAALGETLAETVRASDVAGRYGGEEFLVLLPETDRDGAVVLAEKLRRSVAALAVHGVDRQLSASFGVASLPADGGDGDALVRLAGRALHAAQAAGGNRVEAAGLSIARSL